MVQRVTRDPSTAVVLRVREAQPPLRMTREFRCRLLLLVPVLTGVDGRPDFGGRCGYDSVAGVGELNLSLIHI